jgi:hypothetical protein
LLNVLEVEQRQSFLENGVPAFPQRSPHAGSAVLGDYSDDSSGLPGAVPVAIARPGGDTQSDIWCFGKQASESVSASELARRPATTTCRNDDHAL